MRESESFDAFYARSVANVTSQMHELANGDPQADHAIREAYARAYQQWFEVSGYRDTEKWVLDVAKDAFERRRTEAGSVSPEPPPDTGTWPGMYRPRTPQPAVDPLAAGPGPGRQFGGGDAGPAASAAAGAATPGWFDRGPGQAIPAGDHPYPGAAPAGGPASASAFEQGFLPAPPAQAGAVQFSPPPGPQQAGQFGAGHGATSALPVGYDGGGLPGGGFRAGGGSGRVAGTNGGRKLYSGLATTTQGVVTKLGQRGISKQALAVLAAIALIAVGVVSYFAIGHKTAASSPPAGHAVKPGAKAQPHMLGAGHTGTLAAVPWSLVSAGWTLAQFSLGQPGSPATAGAAATTYLVDPEGGKYVIRQWPAGSVAALIAWSGDDKSALFRTGSGYGILGVRTGQFGALSLPPNVTAFDFTRPDGKAVLAIQQAQNKYKLERYDVQSGGLEAAFATMPVRSASQAWPEGCTTSCAALNSPDGDFAVWAVSGGGMEILSNAGGHVTRLHAPGSGHPAACVPISWWNPGTILADCDVQGTGATQLWLMPANGRHPQPLTTPAGDTSGSGVITGAWQAGGKAYVTETQSGQCSSSASGPAALGIMSLGSSTAINVAGSTGDNAIIGSLGGKLLVLAQTSCPGSSSLLWLDPASGATTPLLTAQSTEAGVTAAVPYGWGTATAGN